MIRIGEFSRISGVSIKALRLYDNIGLLKPARTDKYTGYRYYSADQLDWLNRILTMKSLGLSLKQIANFTRGDMSIENIKRILSTKEVEIHQRVLMEKRQLIQIEEWLRISEKEGSGLLALKESELLEDLETALVNCNSVVAAELTRKAIDLGITPHKVFDTAADALKKVCAAFDKGHCWIPDLVGAATAMLCILPILKDVPKGRRINFHSLGKVVIGTVYGDIHTIGKDMVSALLVANGFEVYDLGVDVKLEDFVEAVKRYKVRILAMSALLSTTALQQRKVINALKKAGIRDRVQVMVGGGAITSAFARDIGADGYDSTAPGAVILAKKLISLETNVKKPTSS